MNLTSCKVAGRRARASGIAAPIVFAAVVAAAAAQYPGCSHLTFAVTAVRESRRTAVALVFLLVAPAVGSAQEATAAAGPFTPASPASLLGFMVVVAGVIGAAIWATHFAHGREAGPAAARRAAWRFVAGTAAWLGGFSLFVGSGALQARPMPLVPIAFISVTAGALWFALSSAGARLARHTPVVALVAFQGFRLPLELVLHAWAGQGTIPASMTWTGSNFDIITGISALALAPFARRPAVAWIANLTGWILLVNVARTALMSSPVPFGWPVEPKLMLVAHLPYAYVGAVCVAGALAGHVILTRRLLRRC